VANVTIINPAVIHAPYIPAQYLAAIMEVKYTLMRTRVDIDTTWYTIGVYSEEIHNWIIALDGGWRHNHGALSEDDGYELREDMYNWFILRWS